MKQYKVKKLLIEGWTKTLQNTKPENTNLCQALRELVIKPEKES